MTTLIFATNNCHKAQEVQSIVGGTFRILTLEEAGIAIEIPEPYDTLEENAWTKADTIFALTQQNCFSEDTGLEVKALNGEPGVRSARYANGTNDPLANMQKLLNNLEGVQDRSARFRTVLALHFNGERYTFEGICEGTIETHARGNFGFGYDPIFVPAGSTKSFAEMTMEEKNRYSHRKKATSQLIDFLSDFGKGKPDLRK